MTDFKQRLADELARAAYTPQRARRPWWALAPIAVVAAAVAIALVDAGTPPEVQRRPAPRVQVAPAAPTIHSEVRVRFTAPAGGDYAVRAERVGARSACVVDRDAVAERRGATWLARLDPRAGEGGNLGWCPGRFRGTITGRDGAVVSRFGFSVAEPPGENAPLRRVCEVGGAPRYFYPHDAGTPVVVLGCVRLATSGKPVDFLGARSTVGECVGPTYTLGGRRGAAERTICRNQPPLSRFAVRDRRLGGAGYGYVIWGTTGGPATVTARWSGGTTEAAVIDVPAARAARFGAGPFGLFVLELPRAARCETVSVTAGDRAVDVRGRGCA